MPEEISPEAKLLKLIRKKGDSLNKEPFIHKEANLSANVTGNALADGNTFGILRQVLKVMAVILSAYIAYEFFLAINTKGGAGNLPVAVHEEIKADKTPLSPAKPYTYYAQKIKTKDIFESPVYKSSGEGRPLASAPELTKKFKLVGIVLDNNNPEAIIEDLETKKTIFLHQGEGINDAVVSEIREGKVILLYQGQNIEITQ